MRGESLRTIAAPFVAVGPSGVAVRTRIKGLTPDDEQVLRLVGAHLGSLASKDLKRRCAEGLEHSADTWAGRKRALTDTSSSRWAGSITKATHDQWALSRRAQLAHIRSLEAGIKTIAHRLSLPVGEKGSKRAPGGYRTRQEWFHKTRRLHLLKGRLERERADHEVGRVRVVRGGKRLLHTRHHLDAAQLTEHAWRRRWEAERWFLQADGESGKRLGNETIRVTPDGEVSLKLPVPLAHLANAPHGRYVLASTAVFHHRRDEWADRITTNRAVAYRIHYDTDRCRWYLTASWTIPPVTTVPLSQARTGGLIGVDTNADHLAAWRLDAHGNPVGEPRRFVYDLSGAADHRDAQVRHALIRLLHWAKRHGVSIAIEDLDFSTDTTREKHGRQRRFRRLISGMPVSKLRARLVSMAAELGITIIAVDP
ncbi:IS200/IS605 family accessory protein TnpB-related protein, partial [Streptomyces sp. NPDC001156]